MMEAGYVGNRALHVPMSVSLDYVPTQFLSKSPSRDQATINAGCNSAYGGGWNSLPVSSIHA
jgi:hypothetical protein